MKDGGPSGVVAGEVISRVDGGVVVSMVVDMTMESVMAAGEGSNFVS